MDAESGQVSAGLDTASRVAAFRVQDQKGGTRTGLDGAGEVTLDVKLILPCGNVEIKRLSRRIANRQRSVAGLAGCEQRHQRQPCRNANKAAKI